MKVKYFGKAFFMANSVVHVKSIAFFLMEMFPTRTLKECIHRVLKEQFFIESTHILLKRYFYLHMNYRQRSSNSISSKCLSRK